MAHEKITQELIDLYTQSPEIKTYLEESIAEAKAINPDTKTNPAQDLNGYLDYIDWASKLAPQEILDNPSDLIRDQIMQSLCYFYFLIDQPIDALANKGLYYNAIQYYPPFADWTRQFSNTWGSYLDTEDAWSEMQYQQFLSDPAFRLKTGDYESPDNWHTFNRFFSRYLASPSKRPISSPDDETIVTSPADSVPIGDWKIDSSGGICVEGGLRIKNVRYYSVNDLLGPNTSKAYANAFNGGVLTHTFLNVFDYHRYHFAVGGTVTLDPEVVQQNVAFDVSWDNISKRYVPIDSTGWQFTQTRGIVVVQTTFGPVCLIPMGMAHVSSVNFEPEVVAGAAVKKGDMLGTFLFGGSDFVMLFPDGANFQITAPQTQRFVSSRSAHLNQFSPRINAYQHIFMGNEYGKMSIA